MKPPGWTWEICECKNSTPKKFIWFDFIYVTVLKWQTLWKQRTYWLLPSTQEGSQVSSGCGFKRARGGMNVVLETSCILIVCMYVLVVILYYSFARCYHWGKLDKRYMGSSSIMFYRCEIEFHFKKEWVHSCLQGVLLCREWDLIPHAQVTSVHHNGVTLHAQEGSQCNDGGAEFSSISSSEGRERESEAGRRAWTSRAPGSSFPKVPSGGHKISDHPIAKTHMVGYFPPCTHKCEVMDRIITLNFLFSLWCLLPIIQ